VPRPRCEGSDPTVRPAARRRTTGDRQWPRRQDGVGPRTETARRLRELRRSRKPLAAMVVASIIAMLSVAAITSETASASGFRVLSPRAGDFPQRVNWVAVCSVTKRAPDDPIVFPGQPGRSHDHTFSGSLVINPSSTADELLHGPTNCTNSGDKSSYWMPTLLVNGKPRLPYQVRAYYRAATRDTKQLHAIPFGLKMLAGDMMATSPQNAGIAGFQCRIEGKGATVKKQSLPPQCGSKALFEMSVKFPNCWDGKNLDSPDHRSHMSYASGYKCDAAHPVQIPQLTLAERFKPGMASGKITLSAMNSPLTLHADFFNAWDPRSMDALMKYCIYAHRFCETVSDDRMPPGMKTTTPGGRTTSVTAPATTSTTETMRSTSNAKVVSPHDHHGSGHHSKSSDSGPAITLKEVDTTTIRVHGFGFPAGKRAKVVLAGKSASRSDVTRIDRKGHFTVSLDIPSTWGGIVRAQATTKSGSVYARKTLRLS
jgi:Domain of unknown function (DUF1996)